MSVSDSERPAASAQGKLAKTPVVHLLLYAYDRKLNGTIELVVPEGERASILFIDGQPAKVRTQEPVMYLGRVLLELGIIDEDDLNASLLEMSRTRRLHGQILRDAGTIDEAQLLRGLERQLQHKLHYIFTLPPETTFAYFDSFDALHSYGGDEIVSADPYPLVLSSMRASPPWEHISTALNRVATTPLRMSRKAEIERFGFEARELQLIELLRARPMKVSELTATEILRPREAQLLAYCLVITKQVSVVQASDSMPPPRLDPTPPARRSPSPPAPSDRVSDPGAQANAVSFAMRAASIRASMPPASIRDSTPSPKPAMITTPSPPPGLSAEQLAALEPELRQRRTDILERAKYIDREDYFQMLDIDRKSTPDEVKSAYFKLAKLWHPDRLPIAITDVRDACSRVFARMGEAHATLTDPKKRENYMKLISEGGATPEAQATIATVIEAATNFQKAEVFLKRNDLVQAEAHAKKAHEADPEQPDYLAMVGWLEALKPENQSEKMTHSCIALLDRAIKISARCERAFFYRGMLYKRLGNPHSAVKDFRKAAELNPRNIDAVREVRLHEMRSQKGSLPPPSGKKGSGPPAAPKTGGGIFGKLFKK